MGVALESDKKESKDGNESEEIKPSSATSKDASAKDASAKDASAKDASAKDAGAKDGKVCGVTAIEGDGAINKLQFRKLKDLR